MKPSDKQYSHSGNLFQKIPADVVVSQKNKEECIARLRGMKPIDVRTKILPGTKNAAVLVPLCIFSGIPCLLFIIRSRSLKVNRGQVAFPGGMEDKTDLKLEQTALRETYEEIGFPSSKIEIWEKGPSLGRENLLISPFLGYLGNIDQKCFNLNENEVSDIFVMSLDHLCDPDYFRMTQFRPKDYAGYKLPVYLGGPEKIWGVTALMTHVFLTALVPNFYRNRIRYQPSISTGFFGKKK